MNFYFNATNCTNHATHCPPQSFTVFIAFDLLRISSARFRENTYDSKIMTNAQFLKKIIPVVAVPLLLVLIPAPEGLSPLAWKLFAIYVGAILGMAVLSVWQIRSIKPNSSNGWRHFSRAISISAASHLWW